VQVVVAGLAGGNEEAAPGRVQTEHGGGAGVVLDAEALRRHQRARGQHFKPHPGPPARAERYI
jgi:hypothetical protein